MIVRVEAEYFRSLRFISQDLDAFQVLVGANGTGKTTFLDVIAFLGDLLNVGPLRAIIGDSSNNVPQRAVDPAHLCWKRETDFFQLAVELGVPRELSDKVGKGRFGRARYEVCISVGPEDNEVRLEVETLWLIPRSDHDRRTSTRRLFPELREPQPLVIGAKAKGPEGWRRVVSKGTNDYFTAETTSWRGPFRLGPGKSALANLPEDETRFPIGTWVKQFLTEGISRVVLNADKMRSPSAPGAPNVFLPDGSNLPWVVSNLRRPEHSDRFDRWMEHVRTAIPDLKNVRTVVRPEDRHRYLVAEFANGAKVPSWGISDGTLRLLALTLIPYLPQSNRMYLVEEPENGIHPRAVETVYTSLSSVYESQVLLASHSPIVLGMARPDNLLCFAKNSLGATDIVRGSEHPRLREWKGGIDLGTLFATGVLG